MQNEAWIDGNVCWIKLTQDQWTQVDTKDINHLHNVKWYSKWDKSTKSYYVMGNMKVGLKWLKYHLHRYLFNLTLKGLMVDHINHDTLDNRRENLRICTDQLNSRNRRNVKGYYFLKYQDRNCWKAVIEINNKKKLLGYFKTEDEARDRYLLARDILGWDDPITVVI